MPSNDIQAHVDAILARDDALDAFRERAAGMTTPSGGAPTPSDIDSLADFARHYVLAVIIMLGEGVEAAERQKARSFGAPLMKIAGQYFLDPDDLIPDELGLYGLIDDAYLAHRFIIRISETLEEERGAPLLDDLQADHTPVIRSILGAEIADRLDAKVEANVNSIVVRNHMAKLAMMSGTLPNGAMEMWRKVQSDKKRMSWTS